MEGGFAVCEVRIDGFGIPRHLRFPQANGMMTPRKRGVSGFPGNTTAPKSGRTV